MQRAHEVLYYVGLGEARYRNVETYSTGHEAAHQAGAGARPRSRPAVSRRARPTAWIPKGRDEMLELIRDLAHNKSVNLILSSHLLPDVEYTCDHVVVMDKGAVATQGPIDALKGPRGASTSCASRATRARSSTCCGARAGMPRHRRGRDARVRAADGEGDRHAALRARRARGVQVRHLRPSVPTLEDVFARRWEDE